MHQPPRPCEARRARTRIALSPALVTALLALLAVTLPAATARAEQRAGWDAAVFGQVFAGYDATWSEAQSFNEFALRRAELGARFARGRTYGFLFNMESVRSAGPQSFFGVAGDSIIVRAKHAFAFWNPKLGPGTLSVRGGLIPDPWIQTVEVAHDLRGISPLVSERGQFFDTSDLGASVAYAAFDDMVTARVAFTNGEGRARAEQNTGKNATTVLSVRAPRFSIRGQDATIALHASYRDGSLGASLAANHRVAAALTFAHPRGFIGAEYVRASGYLGQASLDASASSIWANGQLGLDWLGGFVHLDRIQPDASRSDATRTILTTGLYVDLITDTPVERTVFGFPRLRLYAGYQRERFGDGAAPIAGVPEATDQDRLLITISARGMTSLRESSPVSSPRPENTPASAQP